MTGRFMTMKSAADFKKMEAAGAVVAEIHRAVREAAVPGVTTLELDEVAHEVIRKADSRSSLFMGPPDPTRTTCIWGSSSMSPVLALSSSMGAI